MKNVLKVLMIGVLILSSQLIYSQNWQALEEGEVLSVNNMELSFITSYIKEVKGQDVYQITATLNNAGGDNLILFPKARYRFAEIPLKMPGPVSGFQMQQVKGLSAREGFIYPNPISMQFPFKCNPNDKNPTWESRVVGVGFYEGDYKTKEWRVRVKKGEQLKVMVFNKY